MVAVVTAADLLDIAKLAGMVTVFVTVACYLAWG